MMGAKRTSVVMLAIILVLGTRALGAPLWGDRNGSVSVDFSLLDSVFAHQVRQFEIQVPGEEFRVTVRETRPPNLGVASLSGTIEGYSESFFLLCRGDEGAVTVFFGTGDGAAYRLDRSRGPLQLYPVDSADFGGCTAELDLDILDQETTTEANQPGRGTHSNRSVADDGSRHDIVIAYSPAAAALMGGEQQIRVEAQLAVDAANLTYENSLISSSLRLVHLVATDYDESMVSTYNHHLHRLKDPVDGIMDEMLPLRDQVGADFICVLIDGRDPFGELNTCGVAYVMQPDTIIPEFEVNALSIVSIQCAAPNWTLAHEVGHNRGCAHDRSSAEVDGAYSYSYGNHFAWDEASETGLRTVMAYDHWLYPHERVPYFSHPDVIYGGDATGDPLGEDDESHNALTHQNTNALCATFRLERTFLQYGGSGSDSDGLLANPFVTMAEAVAGSRTGGIIVIQDQPPAFTGVFQDARVFVHDGNGSVVFGAED